MIERLIPLLPLYGVVILVLAFALHRLGIGRTQVIFSSFALFGILSGTLAALHGLGEAEILYNTLGVDLGYDVYEFSIDHLGNPHSAYAHYTIPWALRIPQVFLFTSAVVWSLFGLLLQLAVNLAAKPTGAPKAPTPALVTACLIACLAPLVGAVAHYVISPVWVNQIAILCLSAVIWVVPALLFRLIAGLAVRRVTAQKTLAAPVVTIALVVCLGLSAGTVYVTQSESERQGPTQPAAFPVIEAGPAPTQETLPVPSTDTLPGSAWEIVSLSVTPTNPSSPASVFKIGEEILVTGIVSNAGLESGTAEVVLEINGAPASSQRVALPPGEDVPVRFVIIVPRQGTYTVSVGSLAQSLSVTE